MRADEFLDEPGQAAAPNADAFLDGAGSPAAVKQPNFLEQLVGTINRLLSPSAEKAPTMPVDPALRGSVMEPVAAANWSFRDASAAARRRLDQADREKQFGAIAPTSGPEPSVGSIVSGVLNDVAASGRGARAGVRQAAGDLTGSGYLLDQAKRERAQIDLASAMNTPEFESDTARGIYSGLSSLVRQAPSIAAGIALRSPGIVLGSAVAPMVPDEYNKFRQRGASPLLALPAAAAMAATEYLTEKMPMGVLVNKFGRVGAGEFLSSLLAKEIPGEQIATVVQDAIDTAVANPGKTWGNYFSERFPAAYQTLLATVTQGGLTAGASAGARQVGRMLEPAAPTEADYQALMARVFGKPATQGAPAASAAPVAPDTLQRILGAIDQTRPPTAPAMAPGPTVSIAPPSPPQSADDFLGRQDIQPPAQIEPNTTPPAVAPAPTQAEASAPRLPEQPGQVEPAPQDPVLQNRNRATPSSIAQMQSIAAAPDYGRLGFSRDFANGAPVVAGGSIAPEQLGRTDVAVASDGRRIPVQYAVVDAGTVLTSNRADGTPVPEYGQQGTDALRAIAGNGRIAGLQAAYGQGTAQAYQGELAADTLHGVNPEVVRGMSNPVLVRVMPADQVTADIGDVSNTTGNLNLSPVEQANNDAHRVSLDALQFGEDGSVSPETVRQFVRAMPQAEQGGLIDTNGQPTRQAVDRLNAAVFAKAYGNDQLVRLFAQAQDPEARLIMSALAQVAPKMARLEGAGALDIRAIVAQAAEIAINARRDGIPLARAAQQLDMSADPDVYPILDLFARNPRASKPIVEALGRAADMAYTESTKPSADMFGDVPRASRSDVINQLGPQNEQASPQAVENQAGRQPAQQDAGGQPAGQPGPADSAATQAGRPADPQAGNANGNPADGVLTSYSQADIEKRVGDLEQAQREQERKDREAEAAAKAEADRKDVLARSAAAAKGFVLGGDPMDNLSGQQSMFGPNDTAPQQPETTPPTNDGTGQKGSDSGPGADTAGEADAAARRASLSAVDDLRSAGSPLALALSGDYAARQRTNLVGQKVTSTEDFAILAQLYRDPRFETFRVVFVNDAGVVGSQIGLTSRVAGSTDAIIGNDAIGYFNDLAKAAHNRGATSYYLLHNHPSGNPDASLADKKTTRYFAAHFPLLKFNAHVVIDTNKYSVIDAKGRADIYEKDFGQPEPISQGEWGGYQIKSGDDLMALSKRVAADDGAVTLVMVDSSMTVRSVSTVPRAAVTSNTAANRLMLIRAALRSHGHRVVAVSRDDTALAQLGNLVLHSLHITPDGQVKTVEIKGWRKLGRVMPTDRATRITPDTSQEFVFLRARAKPAVQPSGQRVLEDPLSLPPEKKQGGFAVLGRDQLGRVKFNPGEIALAKLDAASRPLQARFGMRMASPELRRQLRKMKATIDEARRTAANVAQQMSAMSPADREMVSDVVEKMLKPGVIPPEHVVQVADAITRTMDAQTDELVKLGMLSKDSAERWRGRYLPRMYNRQTELGDDPLFTRLFKSGQPTLAGIGGGSLKGRGLFQDVSVDSVDQWTAMGYEVRDPHWKLVQGKLQLVDPNAPRPAREQVTVWRDWTPAERAQMGEIRDSLYRFVQGYTSMQRDIAVGRLFNQIANNTEWVRRSPSDGWVKVPDSEIPDTGGVKRFGNLAGMYVRRDVMSHLTQFSEAGNEALQLYREALGIWKEGKTALNPVAHANNIMANISMAHFAGVSYWDGHKYLAAVRDLASDAQMVTEARNAGLFTGSFTKEELVQSMPPELQALMKMEEGRARKAGRQVMNALSLWLRKPLRNAYEFEDSFFKYLLYRDARAGGMSPEQATDHALRYIFTYDDLPSGARKVRDFAVPFFSWTYKAIPALLHTAAVYPWRFLAPASALWGINMIAYALAAGDEGDDWLEKLAKGRELEKAEREVLPERMRGKGLLLNPKTIRLGTDSVTGNPVFLDVSRVVPGGDIFDMENQAGGLPIPAPFMPNHPVLTAFSALIANREMWFGGEVVDKNDTVPEKAEKYAKWAAGMLLPAIAPGGYHSQRILDATANAMDTVIKTPVGEFTGIDKSGLPVQPKYAAMQTVGVKARPMDLDLEATRRKAQEAALIQSITAEVRSMARLYQRGAVSEDMMNRTRDTAQEKIGRLREKE